MIIYTYILLTFTFYLCFKLITATLKLQLSCIFPKIHGFFSSLRMAHHFCFVFYYNTALDCIVIIYPVIIYQDKVSMILLYT